MNNPCMVNQATGFCDFCHYQCPRDSDNGELLCIALAGELEEGQYGYDEFESESGERKELDFNE